MFSEGEKFFVTKFNEAKVSCDENSGNKISIGENIGDTRRKFHAAKFNPAETSRGEIYCDEISGNEIEHGENPVFLVKIIESTENSLFDLFKKS